MTKTLAAAALLAAALAAPALAVPAVHTRTLDAAGAAQTQLYALNDSRKIVGAEQLADGTWHALFDDGHGLVPLDLSALGADVTNSFALSINARAEIAGAFENTSGYHGFLRHPDGSFEVLDYPGGTDTEDYGVNDGGEVIGVYADAAGAPHAFKRVGGVFTNIDLPGGLQTVPFSVNDEGLVAGEFVRTDGTAGFGYVQKADGSFRLASDPCAPPESTFFISINNAGEVLGAWIDEQGGQHNFVRRGGRDLPVGLPASFGATYFSAQTINDAGDVVGFYEDTAGVSHGVTAFRSK